MPWTTRSGSAGLAWGMNYKIVPNIFPALYSAEVGRDSLDYFGYFKEDL
jgi:hypothetical protein